MDPHLHAILQPYAAVDLVAAFGQFRYETGQQDGEAFLVYLYQRQWIRPEAFDAVRAYGQGAGGASGGGYAAGAAGSGGYHAGSAGYGGTVGRAASGSGGAAAAAGGGAGGPPRFSTTYTFDKVLGEGGMGTVRLAKDDVLRRRVAIKLLKPGMPEEVAGRFLDEARITAQLDHPNVVSVYALDTRVEGTMGYAMRLVHGKELAKLLEERRALVEGGQPIDREHALETVLEHFLKVCDAIAYAHSKGVLHRDLKPQNVMVGRFGEVYVMDWGIAKILADPAIPEGDRIDLAAPDGSTKSLERTLSGQSIGTPEYMSPEQARGDNKKLDGRSDLYTLGLILYEIVCLKPAVTGKTRFEVLTRAVEGRLDPIVPGARGLAPAAKRLRAIIERATAAEPAERYASVTAFADDLRRYLRDEPIAARPDGPFEKLGRWLARHGVLAALIVLSMTTALGAVAFLGLRARERAERRELEVTRFQTAVARQAHRIDRHFLVWEGRLGALAAVAATALAADALADELGVGADLPALSEDFDAGRVAPLHASQVYGKPVSLDRPVAKLAPGADREALAGRLRAAGALGAELRRLFALDGAAGAPAPAIEARLAASPVRWAFVSLAEGIHLAFPGKGGYEPAYDGRKRDWYLRAVGAPGPTWGAPYLDAQGQGLLIACSAAVREPGGAILGVAGVDLTVGHVARELLAAPDAPGFLESCLLDGEGRVVVRSTGDPASEPLALLDPAIVEAARSGASGHRVLAEASAIAVYARIETLGWTYVAWGAAEAR